MATLVTTLSLVILCMCYFVYVQEPTEINIGQPYYVTKFSGRKRIKVLNQDSIVYIPLRRTPQSLLQRPDILSSVNHIATGISSQGKLKDICDGALYKKHPCAPRNIQLTVYFDEIELCNPLGAHTKVHKLGCLFFSIGNIHAKFRSQLKTMFLVALATAPVINAHGIDEVLRPFVKEFQSLHEDKLEVCVGSNSEKYEVACF